MAVTLARESLCPPTFHASLKRRATTMATPRPDGDNNNNSDDALGPRQPMPSPSPDPRPGPGPGPGPGPKRKLPKMNPSERAKYYRRRVREYTESLASTDSALTRDVENLALIHTIQQLLVARGMGMSPARQAVLAHVWEFMDSKQYLARHRLGEPVHFERCAVDVLGDANGVIVQLDTAVRGTYARTTVEQELYPFVPGNARLLDKLLRTTVAFTSAFRFYFDRDGALVYETQETDFAAGLVTSLECSAREARQLLHALGDPDAIHATHEASVQPQPTLAFLETATTELARSRTPQRPGPQ